MTKQTDDLTTRPGSPEDLDFIAFVQKESMSPHAIAAYGRWDDEAQKKQLAAHPAKLHEILEIDGKPIGCSLVQDLEHAFRLVRLYILPDYQGKKVGSQFLSALCSRADEQRRPIILRVMKENPAKRLYERFGFMTTEETETHCYMKRPASQ